MSGSADRVRGQFPPYDATVTGVRRTVTLLTAAATFGLLAALVADLGGTRLSTASQVRGAVGNLSAPWVLVAFVAGYVATGRLAASRPGTSGDRAVSGGRDGGNRLAYGALTGLAATLVALAAFYLVATLVEDLGGHGFVGDLRLELSGNRIYWEDGLVSGPIFGAAGAWWRGRVPGRGPLLVVGALLAGEPLMLALLGVVEPGGVLNSGSGLPLALRILPGFGLNADTPTTSLAVYAAEMAAGVALLVMATRRRRPAN
jgi:hypothetical protein